MHSRSIRSAVLVAAVALTVAPAARAITFNNTFTGAGVNANLQAAVVQAEALWQNTFKDNVTLNLTFNFTTDTNYLAFASSTLTTPSYTTFRNALVADASGTTDAQALASLPAAGPLTFTTRVGGVTAVDNNATNNNNFLAVPRANAKAAGTLSGTDAANDATINAVAVPYVGATAYAYDFDRSNGIDSDKYDIVGVLAHEIGHTMGFVSFSDILDAGNNSIDNNAELRALDLFRRKAAGGGIDVTTAGDPYLSIDGGTTRIGNLSSGATTGDGNQASHWEDRGPGGNAGPVIGIMDPVISNGELAAITAADIVAFDAIGWSVPEPTSLAGLALVAAALVRRRRA